MDASLHSIMAAKAIGVTLPAENIDPDLSMEREDIATTITDDATKDAESVSTKVIQSHDVQDLADLMNQLLSGETSTDDIKQNCIVSKTLANMKPSPFCVFCQCQHVRRIIALCSNSLM